MPSPATPALSDRLPRLRDAFDAADFTVDGITACLGERAARALHREQPLPADLVTRGDDSPLATLVRLFSLGRTVDPARLDRALPGWDTAALVGLGVVNLVADGARATYDLRPYADDSHRWWVISDLSELMTGVPLEPDHVLGVGGASTTLASWTPRTQVSTSLDLGTGCGVQSLHLSGHAGAVTATDTSRRALALARVNAALNGLDWELLQGDLFAPVEGRQFDLIVSNPPFVITPRDGSVPDYEYRDAGRVGDEVVPSLVRRLPDHLAPGGVAQLLGNWEVPSGADWRDVVGGWFDDTGLDAWVIERDSQDPAEYAELWAGDGGHRSGTAGFERMYEAWLDDFDRRGVERIGFGVITVQRPAGDREPWRELRSVTTHLSGPMGPTVAAGLQTRDWLAAHGDEGLLATAWRSATDVTEERHSRPGADDPKVIQLRQGGGLGRTVPLTTVTAALVSVCDGDLTAGAALEAIASLVGASADAVRDEALPTLRELVADGLLVSDDATSKRPKG